ncbi:hypothetical protein I3842_16G090500 [Carya illinoinensis]|uniref:Disease resistance RPP13-like protein 1 n=1 Tax=Carya illinoinensis TaxID=32201 RepID=A0A922D998_CARIL|nr:hypothetical protein I3842_16G090500 [Carya illinoinensis]KAG6673031.1 hypothetical protein I3842_16G090500 [Carya illinoinensis]
MVFAEVILGAVLGAVLQVLVDRLTKLEWPSFAGREGVQEWLDDWKEKFSQVQMELKDATEEQYTKEVVKAWLNDFTQLAYDVEDVLDELSTEANSQRIMLIDESQASTSKVGNLATAFVNGLSPSVLEFKNTMRKKIKKITSRLDKLMTRKDKLNLDNNIVGAANTRTKKTPSTSLVTTTDHMYGREEDSEAVLKLLLSDAASTEVNVISIMGMGGIGKTRLAQFVYNNKKVKNFFNLKAWVCVSEDFDVEAITKTILLHAQPEINCNNMDLNRLQLKLKEAIRRKRFLIVLDDVWNRDIFQWTLLCAPFEAMAPRSSIIITTRDQEVSSQMTAFKVKPYRLGPLSNDACLSLFAQHALHSRDFSAHPELKDISEKIVKNFNGLPLAVKAVGSLLHNKKESKWHLVLNRKVWDTLEETGIASILMLSYHHLPLHLKRCFAYCSIFPKDYEFKKTQVVLLWMAEGLIQQEENIEMEDLGVEYFDNLVSCSLFQQSSKDKSRFLMHEIINYVAKLAAGDTCFRMQDRAKGNDQQAKNNFEKVRHMSYMGGEYDSFDKFEVFSKFTHLRTFLPLMLPSPVTCYLDFRVPLQLHPRLRRLRVLSLRGYGITELSDSISKLKHLRYLDLSETWIKSMPESITDLYNLQTLLLEDCFYLDKLPSMFGNLVNLRHLNILGATNLKGMPRQIGQLKFLQTLSNVVIGDGGCFGIKDLASLSHLQGTLCISNLEKVTELQHAMDADLINKPKIRELSLEWSEGMTRDGTRELNVLNMLQPHNGLKVLTISCYGGTEFPSWLKSPSFHDMVVLTIENCKECHSLPPIGQLPALKVLSIRGMANVKNVGPEFRGAGVSPFRSLETLHFKDMKEWEDWNSCEEFPNLCELSLRSCPKLSGNIPKHLPLLKKVQMDGCGKLPILVSNFPDLCELEVEGSKGVVCRSMDGISSLKLGFLSKSLRFTTQIEGFAMGAGPTNAEDLTIFACKELKCLWSSGDEGPLPHLQFLRLLYIDNCPKLVSLVSEEVEARLQQGSPSMLTEIVIKNCMVLKSLPKAMMYNNNCLQLIRIVKCDSLRHIARGQLPPTLERLEVSYCENLEIILLVDGDTSSCRSTASQLEYLRIQYCPSLTSLTSCGELPRSLKHLNLLRCPQLKSIANRFHHNSFLECIEISYCENLQSLPTGINALSTLRDIDIRNCQSLHLSLDRELLPANLRILHISDCENVSALPEAIHKLTSLEKLTMHHCSVVPGIVPFPGTNLLTNLASLTISAHVRNTDATFEWGLDNLISLNKLEIRKFQPVSFPKMMFPASLTILTIADFPNLQRLSSKGFSKLVSLKELYISECRQLKSFSKDGLPPSLLKLYISQCEKLRSFPKKGLPPSLQELYVFQCPMLAKSCEKDRGQEWWKIAHVLRPEFHTNLNLRPSDPL